MTILYLSECEYAYFTILALLSFKASRTVALARQLTLTAILTGWVALSCEGEKQLNEKSHQQY